MFLKHYLQINNLWLINPRGGDEDRFKSLNYLCPIEIEERDRSPECVKPITTEVNAFLEEGRFKVIEILAAGGCALVEWLETGCTHQILVGGISKLISSKMLLEITKVFGPVKAYHFEFIADSNQQCAFLEYVDHSVNSKACAGLNGLRLGGQVITAVFATPDTAFLEKNGKPPSYGIPEHAKPLLEKPTAVLKLKNVLDPEVLLSLSESELQSVQLCQSTVRTQLSMNLLMLESKLKADRMHISLMYDKKDKKKKIDCTCFICRGRPITTY